MKWCERCGGPLRKSGHCRLCWLDLVEWLEMQTGLAPEEPDNSPCPHASGWWLPEGAREMPETWRRVVDMEGDQAKAFGHWLRAWATMGAFCRMDAGVSDRRTGSIAYQRDLG